MQFDLYPVVYYNTSMVERIEQQRQLTPEQPRARERLSDEQMGNLLSAVGNHEAKAITLILMRNGNIYDRGNLYREVLNSQGKNKGWIIDRHGPLQYCSHSLAPIGLVAMEIINPDLSIYGYAITEDGKELGIPLAGLLLDFSERHNIPLNLLFGSTVSNSKEKTTQIEEGEVRFRKRPPLTTLKILYELLTSPNLPIRSVDLQKRIGENASFDVPRLEKLSKLILIQYNAVESNKPYTAYKLSGSIPEGELPIGYAGRIFTKSVFDIFKNHPDDYLTIGDVYNLLPKEQKEGLKSEKSARVRISQALSSLAKHKYVNLEKFGFGKRSEINLTDEQRTILTELLVIIDRFQDQDPEILEEGRKFARKIISSPKRVSNLLIRAKEASAFANRSSRSETYDYILSILDSHPQGLTNKEIQKLFEEEYDKKLSIGGINVLTFALGKQDSLRVEKHGLVKRYFPKIEDAAK